MSKPREKEKERGENPEREREHKSRKTNNNVEKDSGRELRPAGSSTLDTSGVKDKTRTEQLKDGPLPGSTTNKLGSKKNDAVQQSTMGVVNGREGGVPSETKGGLKNWFMRTFCCSRG